MKQLLILIFGIFLFSCQQKRKVETSFYYWKTVYQLNQTEQNYLHQLHCRKIYIRLMDVDLDENGINLIPISPIDFKQKPADSLTIIPVVFLVNDALKNQTKPQLNALAAHLVYFVNGKLKQAGKNSFTELQLDCDWTASTRESYFYLLKKIKTGLKNGQQLSATLRLHQLKNQQSSGIPPVNRVMLMCYNMGNLRQYGRQNSILEQAELQKYVGKNLHDYPLPCDVALPVFSWSVVFRNHQYAGISKRLTLASLQNKTIFTAIGTNFYVLKTARSALGLMQGDEVRFEAVTADDLFSASQYLSHYLQPKPLNLVYFDLDEKLTQKYQPDELEKAADLLR